MESLFSWFTQKNVLFTFGSQLIIYVTITERNSALASKVRRLNFNKIMQKLALIFFSGAFSLLYVTF